MVPSPSRGRIQHHKDSSIDAEGTNLVMALQNLKKKEEKEINKLQDLLDSLRIARVLPPSTGTTSVGHVLPVGGIVPTYYLPRQQQYQVQQLKQS